MSMLGQTCRIRYIRVTSVYPSIEDVMLRRREMRSVFVGNKFAMTDMGLKQK